MTKAPKKKPVTTKGMDYDKIHAWVNSFGVMGAFAVAIYAALLSQEALQMKKEKLGFEVLPTGQCQLQYYGNEKSGNLGLCWQVTITNQSEDKLSLVTHQAFSFNDTGGQTYMSGFREVEDLEGRALNFPMTLDGGEAKAIVVRVGFLVNDSKQAALIQAFTHRSATQSSLHELEQYLAEHNVDVVGNALDVRHVDGKIVGWSTLGQPKFATAAIRFTTGRKATMAATMSYPPRLDGSESQ